jgi:hypothetical protein
MAEGVERFGWVLGADGENGGIGRRADGGYVRHSDYEKLRVERDAADMPLTARDNYLLQRAEEASRKAKTAEAERDQARNQERQRIEEALEPIKQILDLEIERCQELGDVWDTEADRIDVAPPVDPRERARFFYEQRDKLKEVRSSLAALDTLDPSGEEEPRVPNSGEMCPHCRALPGEVHTPGCLKNPKPVHPSGEQGEEETRKQAAKRNVELGWCPCGEELDSECECGISRLAFAQGKGEPVRRGSRRKPDGDRP